MFIIFRLVRREDLNVGILVEIFIFLGGSGFIFGSFKGLVKSIMKDWWRFFVGRNSN